MRDGQDDGDAVFRAAIRLASGDRLLVLAGAGTSADAGVPTFRDADGLWRDRRGEDLASVAAFHRDPDAVWEWYRARRLQVARCEPHPGQRTLALLQQHLPLPKRVLVATTNEDDLLERGGVCPVLHLHGSLFDTRCGAGCGWQARDDDANGLSFLDCPRCGAAVRPGSVWFGEPLPEGPLRTIGHFAPDACLVVGSSSLVQPASAIAPELALAGMPVVEVNPRPTPLSDIAGVVHLPGQAKTVLPRLVDLMTSRSMRQQATGALAAVPRR